MIFSASFIPFQVLLIGCTDEPEYDLSQIPVAEEAPVPTEDNKTPPKGPDNRSVEEAPLGDEVEDIANNQCAPPYEQTTALTPENSVTASISLDSKALGEDLMIDFIQSEHGELKYGVTCRGTEFSFQIPKMMGSVRVAVFIDKDRNGPSKEDIQGVTDSFTVTDQPITIPPVEWSTDPLSYYNFDSKENPPTNPINDGLSGEVE